MGGGWQNKMNLRGILCKYLNYYQTTYIVASIIYSGSYIMYLNFM